MGRKIGDAVYRYIPFLHHFNTKFYAVHAGKLNDEGLRKIMEEYRFRETIDYANETSGGEQ